MRQRVTSPLSIVSSVLPSGDRRSAPLSGSTPVAVPRIDSPPTSTTTWRPVAGSPLIDAGAPLGLASDYYSAAIGGTAPDIGAVEYTPAP